MCTFIPTADIADIYSNDVLSCDTQMRDFGGKTDFAGRIVTIRCFQDNQLVKEMLNSPGEGKVLVIDAGGNTQTAMVGDKIAKAAADLAKSTKGRLWNIKETALFDQSDLLTGKKGIEYLTADDSKFDRMVSAMFKPADIMDSMVSALAVQSKYNQLVAEGKPSEVAMLEADRWATQIMASRMKGSMALVVNGTTMIMPGLNFLAASAAGALVATGAAALAASAAALAAAARARMAPRAIPLA